MDKLVDVKRTKEDKKEEQERWKDVENSDDYPWGLSIRLDNSTIQKLGLGDLDAEQPVKIVAEGFVSEDSVNKRNGKTVRTLAIQIQKLAIAQEEEGPDASETLYGGGDAD